MKFLLTILSFSIVFNSIGQLSKSYSFGQKYIVNFNNGTLPVYKNGKWGLKDKNGKLKVKPVYDSIFNISPGVCTFFDSKKIIYDVFDQNCNKLHQFENEITIKNNVVSQQDKHYLFWGSQVLVFKSYQVAKTRAREVKVKSALQDIQKTCAEVKEIRLIADEKEHKIDIKYSSGNEITINNEITTIHPPFFISYFKLDDKKVQILNVKTQKTISVDFLSEVTEGYNNVFLRIKDNGKVKILDEHFNTLFETDNQVKVTKSSIIQTGYDEKSQIIFDVTNIGNKEKVLENQRFWQDKKNVAYFIDSSNNYTFLNTSGKKIYEVKLAEPVSISEKSVLLENKEKLNLIFIYSKSKNIVLTDTGEEILNTHEIFHVLDKGHPILFSQHSIFDLNQMAQINLPTKKLEVLNDSLVLVQLYNHWKVINIKNNKFNSLSFNKIKLDPFIGTTTKILTTYTNGKIEYFDKKLNRINQLQDMDLRFYPVLKLHSKEKGKNLFKKVVDKKSNKIIGLVDSQLRFVWFNEEIIQIFIVPDGNYFFIQFNDNRGEYLKLEEIDFKN